MKFRPFKSHILLTCRCSQRMYRSIHLILHVRCTNINNVISSSRNVKCCARTHTRFIHSDRHTADATQINGRTCTAASAQSTHILQQGKPPIKTDTETVSAVKWLFQRGTATAYVHNNWIPDPNTDIIHLKRSNQSTATICEYDLSHMQPIAKQHPTV